MQHAINFIYPLEISRSVLRLRFRFELSKQFSDRFGRDFISARDSGLKIVSCFLASQVSNQPINLLILVATFFFFDSLNVVQVVHKEGSID